jgi:hypothetical protein
MYICLCVVYLAEPLTERSAVWRPVPQAWPECRAGDVQQRYSVQERHVGSTVGADAGAADGSPAFYEFLSILGTKVQLQGYTGYRAGLDVEGTRFLSLSLLFRPWSSAFFKKEYVTGDRQQDGQVHLRDPVPQLRDRIPRLDAAPVLPAGPAAGTARPHFSVPSAMPPSRGRSSSESATWETTWRL